ncbi:hypothetical protein RB195_018781 [Necator americanus]
MILIGATGKASHISTLDPAPAPLYPYSIASQQAQTSVQERHDQGSNSKDVSNLHAANTVNSRTTPTTNLLICTPITLFNPESLRRIHTTAFFDCGASITMIKKQIATDLNLNIEEEQPLSLQTFGNDEDQIHPSSRTNVGLVLENDDSTMLRVRTLSFLSQPMQMGLAKDHIRGDMPACSTTTQPGLVIGNDYFWELVLSNNFYVEKLPNGYDLVHTRLGNIKNEIIENASILINLLWR